MKFSLLILFVQLSAFIACSVAFKNPECGELHSKNFSELPNGVKISCMARGERWSYDAEGKQCVKFIYGGCGANGNIFGSKQQCETRCLE